MEFSKLNSPAKDGIYCHICVIDQTWAKSEGMKVGANFTSLENNRQIDRFSPQRVAYRGFSSLSSSFPISYVHL